MQENLQGFLALYLDAAYQPVESIRLGSLFTRCNLHFSFRTEVIAVVIVLPARSALLVDGRIRRSFALVPAHVQ